MICHHTNYCYTLIIYNLTPAKTVIAAPRPVSWGKGEMTCRMASCFVPRSRGDEARSTSLRRTKQSSGLIVSRQ
ncbi:MAG: hypothetical protein LBF85_02635 [Tannerella sp.]|nr:hypothetical protein [Tannerella sp.]